MITIHKASTADISLIQAIAYKTWPLAYGSILSEVQIQYMLDAFYSAEVLANNMNNNGHYFTLAWEDNKCMGFASFEHDYMNLNTTRIHKLYVLPETQGKGVGKILLNDVEYEAIANQSNCLNLNVNRFNSAKDFYSKMGFKIIKEFNLDIGNDYWMEDFIMEKKLE